MRAIWFFHWLWGGATVAVWLLPWILPDWAGMEMLVLIPAAGSTLVFIIVCTTKLIDQATKEMKEVE